MPGIGFGFGREAAAGQTITRTTDEANLFIRIYMKIWRSKIGPTPKRIKIIAHIGLHD
jgi:hypothetical protein